jgi:hypothetical protein
MQADAFAALASGIKFDKKRFKKDVDIFERKAEGE